MGLPSHIMSAIGNFEWFDVVIDFSYGPFSLFIIKVSDLRIYEKSGIPTVLTNFGPVKMILHDSM